MGHLYCSRFSIFVVVVVCSRVATVQPPVRLRRVSMGSAQPCHFSSRSRLFGCIWYLFVFPMILLPWYFAGASSFCYEHIVCLSPRRVPVLSCQHSVVLTSARRICRIELQSMKTYLFVGREEFCVCTCTARPKSRPSERMVATMLTENQCWSGALFWPRWQACLIRNTDWIQTDTWSEFFVSFHNRIETPGWSSKPIFTQYHWHSTLFYFPCSKYGYFTSGTLQCHFWHTRTTPDIFVRQGPKISTGSSYTCICIHPWIYSACYKQVCEASR